MREQAIAFIHSAVQELVPSTADFHNAAKKVIVENQLKAGRPWVKLYMPSEEGDGDVIEEFLVIIDCGAIHAETARALAETIRAGLAGNMREPSPFRRTRIIGLNEDNFYRVQLSYRLRRPAYSER